MAAGIQSPTMVTPSRSFQSFSRSQDVGAGLIIPSGGSNSLLNRISLSPLDTFGATTNLSSTSSQTSSSASSSAPNTPTGKLGSNITSQYPRPSTLHGLKHKLHSSPCSNVKSLHAPASNSISNRRKSVGHIPLSPLARSCGEKSPSPLPASSPTRSDGGGRSPSPLAWPIVHQPGSSNTTQSYSPSSSGSIANIGLNIGNIGVLSAVANAAAKKGFARPKSAVEPSSSPLLRRALSPDRLHPDRFHRDANKCVLSPLCCNGPIKSQRPVSGVWRSNLANMSTTISLVSSSVSNINNDQQPTVFNNLMKPANSFAGTIEKINEDCEVSETPSQEKQQNTCSMLSFQSPGEMLPRIAEEKDSPSNTSDFPGERSHGFVPVRDKSQLEKHVIHNKIKHKIITAKPPAPPAVFTEMQTAPCESKSRTKSGFFSTSPLACSTGFVDKSMHKSTKIISDNCRPVTTKLLNIANKPDSEKNSSDSRIKTSSLSRGFTDNITNTSNSDKCEHKLSKNDTVDKK
jgi:hypothetical protein